MNSRPLPSEIGSTRRPRSGWALVVMAVAAAGSLATSTMGPFWTVQATAPGDPFPLNDGGPSATRHATVHLNAAALSGDPDVSASLVFDATACLVSNTSGGAVRMRMLALPDGGSTGDVMEQVVPACPQTVPYNLVASGSSCVQDTACDFGAEVTFQRVGGAASEVQVNWNANGFAFGYGADEPPAGSSVTVSIP